MKKFVTYFFKLDKCIGMVTKTSQMIYDNRTKMVNNKHKTFYTIIRLT